MSIRVMQWVWDHSQSQNAARLVLLAIADNASDDGGNAYPSSTTLQRKANLSERGVQTAVAKLIEIGELEVQLHGGRRGTNMYRIIMTPADSAGVRRRNPADSAPPPPQNLPPTPADSAGITVLEPSVEPSSSSFDAEASPNAGTIIKGFIDWLAQRDEPVRLTPQVIARYGKEIKTLLGAGFSEMLIKRALVVATERGMVSWPSKFQSFVVEVQNRPVSAPPAGPRAPQFKSSAEQNIERSKIEKHRYRLADAMVEHEGMTQAEALALVEELSDEEITNMMRTSTSVGYSDGDVVDAEVVGPEAPLEVES